MKRHIRGLLAHLLSAPQRWRRPLATVTFFVIVASGFALARTSASAQFASFTWPESLSRIFGYSSPRTMTPIMPAGTTYTWIQGAQIIKGTLFDSTGLPLSGRTIKLLQNGTSAGTTTTDGSGVYSFTGVTLASGDKIAVYISGALEKGATVTLSGTADITDLDIRRNVLIVRSDNGGSITNFNLREAGGGSPDEDLKAVGSLDPTNVLSVPVSVTLEIWTGSTYAPLADINDAGNWTNNGTFAPGANTVTFNGVSNQTIAGSSSTTFNNLTISNTGTSPDDVVSLDGSAGATNTVVSQLIITGGVFDQGTDLASSDLTTIGGGTCVEVRPGKTWRNRGRGDETLSCDVFNEGTIEFNAAGRPCGDNDEIQIRSSVPGTQRTWEGPGVFSMIDVDVRDQRVPGGSNLPLQILVNSGTNSLNNTGWTFSVTCAGPYTWIGGTGQRWADEVNWSPIRPGANNASTSDVLIFDGSVTPATVVEDVQSQTNSAIRLQNGAVVTLHANIGGATLTLEGATGQDFEVPTGTLLTVAGGQPLIIELTAPTGIGGSVPAGHVAGQILMKDDRHQLIGANAGEIIITGALTINPTYSAITHPFGSGKSGSVVFQSGSTGVFGNGLDPLGGQGRSVVTFNAGSTAHFFATTAFLGDAGTYGNLIFDGNQNYTIAGSSPITILNNLEIEAGSTFLLSNSPGADLNLYGNFVDKTLMFNGFSSNSRVVKFLGTTQTVSKAGGGIFRFDDVLINQSPGGKVQLLSPTDINGQLNLSTADAVLELNGQVIELLGTVTGPGNLKGDPNAVIAVNGVGALGTVNFVSGGRTLLGLLFNRLTNGSMTLGTSLDITGTLRLDNGILNTGANTLSLSSVSSVLRTNGYVIGNLQKDFGASGNLGSFTFPLGTANAYSPLDANVTANTNGTLTVKAVQGQQPNIPGANRLRRYWTLSGSGITADLTFHYSTSPTNDVVGNEAIYKIFKYDGSFTQFTPDATGVNSASDHFATLNNVSSFSDWTLAEPTVVNPGTVAFVGAPYTTTEGSADHDVTITVARSVGTDGALDVTYATSNGTATAGSDYISATGTLHWDNGETGSKTFPITVRGDTTYEADETVTITLSDVTGGATIGDPNPTTLTITNDDNPPATLVVNTTNDVIAGVCDATHCSLREAINAANFSSDTSTINFNIPNTDPGFAGGVYTIVVIVTALPTITQPVTIDGASQTTFNGDTNVDGPEIVLTGAVLGGPNNGLVTANTAANSIIKDLVVNGFGGTGITVDGNNIQVLNSYIGTNASGTVAVANAVGLAVGTSSAPTSGYTITGNLISGNTGVGISGCNVQGATFSNNKIGTDRTGVNNVGNVSHGFLAACTSFRDTTISNNTIAFNGGDGFRDAPEYVGSTSANDHPNNRLTQNSIFENGGLGINLKEPPNGSLDLVTPNDPGDGDEGGNHLQNFPVVTVATAGSTVVTGTLNTTPSTSGYVIELFSNPACNTFGHGEGKTFLGAVTTGATDNSGNVNFTVTVPALLADQVLAATATDANGNTSEFSACFPVTVAPTLSIGDATVTEGSSGGTTNANFILLLSAPMAQDVIVGYSTQDDTATGGTDYVAITNGSTTIPAGQIAGIITVTVNQDTVNEPNETFFVNISSSSPVTISDGQGLGTVTDDDPVPTISIDDVTHNEGNAGTTNYTFTVTLSNPSQGTITVAYQTQDNSAAAPGDYTAVSTPQTLTFVPGDTSEQVTIQVNGDTLNEANETFFVNLSSNSATSTILDGQGLGTINNDDAVPAITFPNSATQVEGNSGQTELIIQVNLATASGQTASVDWATGADPGATHPATAGSTCGAGIDYLTSSGTVTFAPGATTGSIHIPVCGDTDPEFDETFRVTISNPVNASIPVSGDVSLTTITNDDTPTLSIVATASQTEANTGQANMPFAVTLSVASEQTVTVHYATANGSTNPATGGIACGGTTDYVTTSGTLTFNPTETVQTINVPVCGDTREEPDETFTVTLDTPTNATISQATGTGTITNDDHAPVANAVNTFTPANTLKTITLSATDADGDALTFSIVDSPQHGTLSNFGTPSCSAGNCTETVDYTPTVGYTGPDTFTYKANDGANDSNTATVSINVFACPTTFTVNSLGDESDATLGDGLCDVDGNASGDQCTLRAAIEEANALSACGPITIDATGLSGQLDLGSALPAINHNVNINGPGAATLTVQRSTAPATPEFRIFAIGTLGNVTVAISGLTISNGTINDASLSQGGGIFIGNGSLTLTGVAVAGNSVGGPVSAQGGGIYNALGALTITNSTISGNSATAAGENDGGGIYNSSTLTVINSTVSGNSVSGGSTGIGGGIYSNGTSSLTNCTVSNNSASGSGLNQGGGINNVSGSMSSRSTIISGNTCSNGPDFNGALTSLGHNLIGNTSGATVTPQPGDRFDANASPLNLGPLANNGGPTQTMALGSGSVAIDGGDDCVADSAHCGDPNLPQLTTDQRGTGFPRQVDGNNDETAQVDIGAYEAPPCTPPATPTASNGGPYCEGASIQLSTPTVAGATYAWTGPNGFTSSVQNPTRPNATTADAGTYSVTITVNGCASAAGTTNVVVNPTPATPIASNGGPYCEGATIQLSTPTVAGATYSWTGPNGFTSSLQNPTRPNATTADAGTYSLTIVVDACASAAGSTNVVVNATPPTPTASNGGPYCEGATIQLSTPTVSGASYSWTGPNGFTSSLQNPTRPNATTADAGTYSVTITVNGCASAAGSTNVVVNPTPATPTVSNGGPYCEGATIQLSTPAVAGATYAWTGPNGFTSSLQNPTRPNATTADAGTYSVTITVNGCASAAGSTNVVVNATPATPTASNGGPYCEGATIQLSTPTVAGATYAWTGPNGFTSSLQNPTRPNATTADAVTYSVTITVNGCSSAAGSTNVVVNATPATPTASNGGPYCEGATIQLSTPTVAGATYAWTGPNGFTSSLQNPTRPNATTADAGTYSVTITVNGCSSAAGSTNVVVNPTPATPTASNGGPYCEGATISLSTPTVAGATYSWTGPSGFTSSLQNPTRPNATTADAGTYSVTITVNGCASAAGSTNVVVNPTPATPTASNGGPYLEGATIQLSTPTVAGATYSWTGPNSFTSSIQNPTRSNATTADAGTYSVTITVNGCPSAAGTTNVVVNPNAAPTITDPGTLNLDPNSSAQFDIFANDANLGQNLSFSVAVGDVSCPDPPAGKFSSISFSGTTQLSTNPNNWKSVLTINALAGSQGSYTQKIQVTDGVTPTTRCLSITVAEPDTGVTLIGGNLVITDVNGGNSSDAVTLSLNGSNVRINDPIHVLGCGAGVSIDTHTCEFPLTSITGNIQVDGAGGNDTLTLALGGGNFIPQPGGVIYNGGDPTSAPGDQLIITGGNQGTVTYQYTNAHDGSIAMSNAGTVTYTGLEPISNTGTATDIIFELPPGPNAVTLADDGTGGNTMSRLSGATFETTDFANPTGSLTIRRGNAADTIAVNALPDFDANLTIGLAGNEFSTVTFSGAITLASNNALAANASGSIDLSNGSNALTTSGTGTMNFTAANVTGAGNVSTGGGLTVGNTGSSSTLSGVIAGTGGLTKLGAGTLVLSGANTYTGATAVNAGRLNIDGSIDSNTSVNSGATLSGMGTINSANTLTVNSGGVVAPGTSPGIFNTGSVTLNSSSSLAVEIGGTTPGNAATNHDQLNVTGTVSLVNAVLGLASFNGFAPSAGQSFVIISNDGTDAVTGTFNGLPEGATIPSFLGSALKATITYAGGTGNDVVLTAAAPVPGNLQFSAANYDDTEQNSGTHTATITVQRVGGIDGAVSVHWATSAGTATPGSDYTESTGDLNWADGDAGDKTLTVTVSGDTNFEANETVNLTLSAPTGGAGLGTPNLATLTITNDEIATNISIQDAQVVEPSSGSVTMIFTVTLSAPAPAGGVTVNFTTQDEPPASNHATAGQDYTTTSGTVNFASGEQFKTIAVTVLTDSNVESNETYLVLLSSPVNGTIADGTATGTILIADQPGTVLISELRTSGPGGAGDDFVEIYNNTDSPLTIAASDASAGYGLYKMGADCNTTPVLIGVILNGTIIPARGHYLFVGSAYSLADYGGTGAAAGDQTLLSDVESDHNVALFTTAEVASISSTNRLDAVGFGANTGGVCDLLREGTTLSPMVGSVLEYSFFRDECGKKGNPALFGPCPSGGFVKDANVNGDDLVFADTTAAMTMAGQRLGAPGPQNLASPTLRNSSIAALLIDSTVVATAPPNRVRDLAAIQPNAANGTLSIRRRFVNNTGAPVTRLRFRIMDISAFVPPGSVADMRALTSGAVTVNGVGDSATCLASNGVATTPCTITVEGTTMETPPAQALGGGLHSTMSAGTITLATPLAAGASINLHFLLGVQQPGSFKFFVNIEALGGGAPAAPTTTTIIRTSVTKPTSP